MAGETQNNVWPLSTFYFSVNIDGKDYTFQEASGLALKTNTEEFTNLVVKRGVVTVNSQLATWCSQTIDSGLSNPVVRKSITLSLMDANAKPLQTWNFVYAWPVKWDISDLKNMEGEIVIETIEFAYSYFNTKNYIWPLK